MSRFYLLLAGLMCLVVVGCSPELPEEVAAAYKTLPEELDYNLHVKPIWLINALPVTAPIKPNKKRVCGLILPNLRLQAFPKTPIR